MTAPYSNLLTRAVRLLRSGDAGAADAICRHVLAVDPANATALYIAGLVAHDLGDHARSLAVLDQALAAQPDFADALSARGLAHRHLCHPEASIEDFQRALALNPDLAQAHFYIGLASLERNDLTAAAEKFERALACEPALVMALTNLGLVRHRQGQLEDAIQLYRRAVDIQPSLVLARTNLATALQDLGRASEALAILQRLDGEISDPMVGASVLTCMNLVPGSAQEFCAAARHWAARFADPLTPERRPQQLADPERRLRVGYVGGPGLRRHTLAMTYLPLFEAHDPAQVEIFAYSDLSANDEDDVTQQMRAAVSTWRRTGALNDAALANQIRADQIDILVDGIGFATGTRLLAAARRPAPIQVHFPPMSTTGMKAFHAVIGDRQLLPEGIDGSFRERLWRLDCGFLYRPLDDLPTLAAPPAVHNGFVTFGSFNRMAKVGPETVAIWAAVLKNVPTSRMIIRSTTAISDTTARLYRDRFAAQGIAPDRVDIGGSLPHDSGALLAFNDIDIALDTVPFGGVLTTCAALAMGVPTVTLAAPRILDRYGAAILTAVGFADGIAVDEGTYVDCATKLATTPERLAKLRMQLRDRLFRSPLCDSPAFARSIETAFRAMWRQWCAESTAEPDVAAEKTGPGI